MKVKDIMYGCIAILMIAISVSVCVFTYTNLSKVRFTCEVGNVKATCYVNYGDEQSMSLLYAQLVHAIKNSEKVYREKCAVQQPDYRPSKHQQNAINRARDRRKVDDEKSTDVTMRKGDTHVTLELSDEASERLNEHFKSYSKEYWKNYLDSVKKGLIEI